MGTFSPGCSCCRTLEIPRAVNLQDYCDSLPIGCRIGCVTGQPGSVSGDRAGRVRAGKRRAGVTAPSGAPGRRPRWPGVASPAPGARNSAPELLVSGPVGRGADGKASPHRDRSGEAARTRGIRVVTWRGPGRTGARRRAGRRFGPGARGAGRRSAPPPRPCPPCQGHQIEEGH